MYLCMYICRYVFMYVHMYVCMYVCKWQVHTCMYERLNEFSVLGPNISQEAYL